MANQNKRKSTNELEWQGHILGLINSEIRRRPGLGLDQATQEKPRKFSGKRNDLVIWTDRTNETAFLSLELKTPETPITDLELFRDALEKAQQWRSRYFGVWNLADLELYETPPSDGNISPADALFRRRLPVPVTNIEDWLRPEVRNALEQAVTATLDAAHSHAQSGRVGGQAIDTEIFVARLSDAIKRLRGSLYKDLSARARSNKTLRASLKKIAAEQGFSGFVEDIEYAIAGQYGYRIIGQILFYHALRRKQPSLRELKLSPKDRLPDAFSQFWDAVRRFDYEALFKPSSLESLVTIPVEGQQVIQRLVEQLSFYDWASLSDDILGSVFEHLIPHEEQILLGQFYTPRPVADLLCALTLDGERPVILDPGCGSGTFLMSSYGLVAHRSRLTHKDLLSIIWGFDISPFAAELAVINLYRQEMSEFENFPRIVVGNFFDREPGQTVEFPAPKATAQSSKIPVPIPKFNSIVGNPPYLRSQNQDDLDPGYRAQLFTAAAKAGVKAPPKSDLFAFFIYHALRFMQPGSRLGLVTPASWLTSDYAFELQQTLLTRVNLVAIVSSQAESFFPQVDVNAVLLIAEMPEERRTEPNPIRFVTLKQAISRLAEGSGDHWEGIEKLVDEIEGAAASVDNDRFRLMMFAAGPELELLTAEGKPRNWSKYLRAPLSYYTIFGAAA